MITNTNTKITKDTKVSFSYLRFFLFFVSFVFVRDRGGDGVPA